MKKILIITSTNLKDSYKESVKEIVEKINKENKLKLKFTEKEIIFQDSWIEQMKSSPNSFLNSNFSEIEKIDVNSIIYIPDSSVNLYGNYLWYSLGEPINNIMVISSFLFKVLFKNKITFGPYLLLIYSQFLARYAVELKKPHDKSKNCLNDHCEEQLDLLNVFKNPKDILCTECAKKKINKEYYEIAKFFIDFIKKRYYKKKKIKRVYEEIEEYKTKKNIEIEIEDGYCYEFEIYMAKKCANISNLYEKLDGVLSSPNHQINGYSLYEVGGGWRGDIDLLNADENDWKELCRLSEEFGENDFKDIIRPLIDNKRKCAVFDENSIVLRIIIVSKFELYSIDIHSSQVIREIVEIFEDITENEKSVFFTLKKLYKVGQIKRKDNGNKVILS